MTFKDVLVPLIISGAKFFNITSIEQLLMFVKGQGTMGSQTV